MILPGQSGKVQYSRWLYSLIVLYTRQSLLYVRIVTAKSSRIVSELKFNLHLDPANGQQITLS